MTARIHPSAVVDPGAELGLDVVVEPFAIVGAGVRVGAGATVGARATLLGPATIGAGCSIGVGAVIGTEPQDAKFRGERTTVEIGDDTTIREYVTVNRGTTASGVTSIGRRCFLMAYAHVAHDCHLGDNVVLANSVQLGGHVEIDDHAHVGGATAVHQFTRIGRRAFVGGGSRVTQDVPPFSRGAGNPMRLLGINAVGLQRGGVPPDVRAALHRAFRLVFNSKRSRQEAVEQVRAESGHVAEVAHVLEFLSTSERGVTV